MVENSYQPGVSVLMNCYNGERYLEESVQSLLDQSYSNWELEFWDNQSSDKSAQIVQAFNDDRIHYHCADSHTHLGAGRRAAQHNLTGDWIAVLDADDRWHWNKLEKQLALAQALEQGETNTGLIYSLANLLIDQRGQWVETGLTEHTPVPPPDGNVFSKLARNNFIPLLTVLIKREAFDAVGGFLGRYKIAEDYSLNLRLAKKYNFAAVNEPLAAYRVHEQAVTKRSQVWMSDFEDIKVKIEHWNRPAAMVGVMISVSRLFGKLVKG